MDTIITIDLAKGIVPVEVVAILHGLEETTKQRREREKATRQENAQMFEIEARANINAQLLEKGYAVICPMASELYYRADIIKICKKLRNEFSDSGYTIGGWGEYALSNKKIYELCVFV